MVAYRWIRGRLEAATWVRPVEWEMLSLPFDLCARAPLRLTSRERRVLARAGARGRRGAHRVSPMRRPAMPEVRRWTAHLFRWAGSREVLLYLPDGERPTEEHERALARLIRCTGS